MGRDGPTPRGWAPNRDEAKARFDWLFDAHSRDLTSYLLRRADTPEDAADLVAEVFLVVWRRLADVPPEPEARLWLFGVARRALSTHRRGRRRRHRLAEKLRRELATPAIGSGTDSGGEPVIAALALLSADDRELLTLVAWDGLTPQEAAQVLGIEPGAARVRLHRARRRLYQSLNPGLDTAADAGLGSHPAAEPECGTTRSGMTRKGCSDDVPRP